jgi:hypothetical protein
MALADPEDLWPQLEQLGEKEVRRRFVLQAFGNAKLPAVLAWLDHKAEERQEAHRTAELGVLRSTKNAAWLAAVGALAAAMVTGWALACQGSS